MSERNGNGNGKVIGRVALGLVAGALLAVMTWMANGVLASEKHIASTTHSEKQLNEIKVQLTEMQREVTEIRLILARQRLDGTGVYTP